MLTEEPIRTIHHFACTGGTVISKCIAVMPNVQLLSEIDPLSRMSNVKFNKDRNEFAPADLFFQLRQSSRGVNNEAITRYFINQTSEIYEGCSRIGQRLVLRDHAHSMFCTGVEVEARPTLKEILDNSFRVCSVVTVRHPIDSYLSLRENKWLHFQPDTLDEYCSRYLAFLQRHQGVPIIKYEDFSKKPRSVVAKLCKLLTIPYRGDFMELLDVIRLTGDSGRKGETIAPRPRRERFSEIIEEAKKSQRFSELCQHLSYQ